MALDFREHPRVCRHPAEALSEGAWPTDAPTLPPVRQRPTGLSQRPASGGLLINGGSRLAHPGAGAQQGLEEHPRTGEEDEQSPSVGRNGQGDAGGHQNSRRQHRSFQASPPRQASRGAPANPLITEVLKEGLQGWVCRWVPDTVVRRRGSGGGATLSRRGGSLCHRHGVRLLAPSATLHHFHCHAGFYSRRQDLSIL